jgi:hypothetical protein
MVEETKREIERFKHDFIAHPLMAVAHFLAHITHNNLFNEIAEAIHESIGQENPQ